MLNKGLVLLSVAVDLLIQLLFILEWVNPIKNIFLISTGVVVFKSRWTWQVLLPSSIIYNSPKIKNYFTTRIKEIESLGKLELLLRANSLSQHILYLKDRLFWLYKSEISGVIDALQGSLSFEIRLMLITCIIIFFGFFNLSPLLLEIVCLHILLKHSSFGHFYCNSAQKVIKDSLNYIRFALFYKDLEFFAFPPPFKLIPQEDLFVIEIVENVQGVQVTFTTNHHMFLSPEHLHQLKPIVELMQESISHWQTDLETHKSFRVWKRTRTVLYDYNDEEWRFFRNVYNIIRGSCDREVKE